MRTQADERATTTAKKLNLFLRKIWQHSFYDIFHMCTDVCKKILKKFSNLLTTDVQNTNWWTFALPVPSPFYTSTCADVVFDVAVCKFKWAVERGYLFQFCDFERRVNIWWKESIMFIHSLSWSAFWDYRDIFKTRSKR